MTFEDFFDLGNVFLKVYIKDKLKWKLRRFFKIWMNQYDQFSNIRWSKSQDLKSPQARLIRMEFDLVRLDLFDLL